LGEYFSKYANHLGNLSPRIFNVFKINKIQNLQISDFDETEMEVAEWENFANVLTAFGFVKCFSKDKQCFQDLLVY
jgi:hypothetical protein